MGVRQGAIVRRDNALLCISVGTFLLWLLLVAIAAATTPKPHLIAPVTVTRTPSPQANRDFIRPWPSSKGLILSPQGMNPAGLTPPSALSSPATATVPLSPSDSPRSVATQRPAAVTPPAAAGPSAEQWAILRHCESGDDYSQRANPHYRGGYQIGFVEWRTYGGTGYDPADATPAEQDAVALRLWQARGWEPWAASSKCTGLR